MDLSGLRQLVNDCAAAILRRSWFLDANTIRLVNAERDLYNRDDAATDLLLSEFNKQRAPATPPTEYCDIPAVVQALRALAPHEQEKEGKKELVRSCLAVQDWALSRWQADPSPMSDTSASITREEAARLLLDLHDGEPVKGVNWKGLLKVIGSLIIAILL